MRQNDYVTRTEFQAFAVYVESRFSDIDKNIDKKFEELRQLIVDIAEHLTKKIDMVVDRLDIAISQNALEHHKFEIRFTKLESKSS